MAKKKSNHPNLLKINKNHVEKNIVQLKKKKKKNNNNNNNNNYHAQALENQKEKREVKLVPRKKKKEKKEKRRRIRQLNECTWAFLSIKKKYISTQFSPHFREKQILLGLEKKHLSHTIYFPSSPSNQTYSKNVFLSIFSSKFSIHTISPLNKKN